MSEFKPFKIGKYLLLERLATGGMAEVYRARASGAGGFEKQLAIKRILPNYSSNEEFRRMFEYEARLSSMLTHANIVQIYDFVKSNETYLLAMEYVDGKNLRQFVNKVKKMGYAIPIEFSIYVMNEVCKGLEYAHNKKDDLTGKPLNIIHRDMSPQNIMISYEGAVKIVDFGIAKAKDRVDETRSGVIKGKFGYMSPEQANGLAVDHRTDIFSTAIILYELLTNRRLFAADNDLATLKLIQECVIPKPAIINPKISFELEKILMRGLTKDQGTRFQNAGQFHRQLQEFMNKEFPSFTLREASDILHRVFASEIDNEKKRFEQLHRQSIPFSQGVTTIDSDEELVEVKNVLEGEITRSQHESNTAITYADENPAEELSAKSAPASVSEMTSSAQASHSQTLAQENTKVESVVPEEDLFGESMGSATEGHTIDSVSTQMKNSSIDEKTQDGMPLIPEKVVGKKKTEQLKEGSVSESTVEASKSDVGLRDPLNRPLDSRRGSYSLISNMSADDEATQVGDPVEAKEESPQIQRPGTSDRSERNAREELSHGNSPSILVERPAKDPSYHPHARYEREERSERSVQKKSAVSFLLVFGLLGVTALLYRFLLSGKIAGYIPKPTANLSDKPPVVSSSEPSSAPVKNLASLEDKCNLSIASDPAGATILVNKTVFGVSPRAISVKCKESVNITLKREGYETLSANVLVDKRDQNFMKSLRRIPTGELEFILDVNAKVFVDGEEIGLAIANKPFNFPVRADLKHKVRFVNDVLDLEFAQEYTAQDGLKLTFPVKMSEPPRQPTNSPGRKRR